jgi:hypothetical protein
MAESKINIKKDGGRSKQRGEIFCERNWGTLSATTNVSEHVWKVADRPLFSKMFVSIQSIFLK